MAKSGESEDLGKLREMLDSKDKGYSAIRKRVEGRNKRFQEKQDKGEDVSGINNHKYGDSPAKKAELIYNSAFMGESGDERNQNAYSRKDVFNKYDKQDFEEALLYQFRSIAELGRKGVKDASPEQRYKEIGKLQEEIEKTEKILSDKEMKDNFNVSDEEMENYKKTFSKRAYEGAENAVKASQKDSEYRDTRAGKELINYIQNSEIITEEDNKTNGLENKVAGAFSLSALGIGAVLSYSGITGNVVSQSANASSGTGALLVVLGAIAGLYYFKK
ncbi:MAG: hypothetical protein ABEI74_00900 [Candidatus Pacearchaeota archaeon]